MNMGSLSFINGSCTYLYIISLLIFILCYVAPIVDAVPADSDPFNLVQPDDYSFEARQVGDERHVWVETMDGYTIAQDRYGWWVYVQGSILVDKPHRVGYIDPQQIIIEKHIRPDYINKELEPTILSSPSAVIGTENLLVILIDFTDTSADLLHTSSYYDNLLFDRSPSGNSMYVYYKEVSYDLLDVNGTVSPSWYHSEYPLSYYGVDTGSFDSDPSTPDNGNTYIFELAREAVQLADPYVDFSQYDKDGDGVVDHVVIVHAGACQAASGISTDIWSHKWSIFNYHPENGWLADGEEVDGVRVIDYTMQAEDSPLGTFVHEFGHDLGLPDLYDLDYSSGGIGDWGLMGMGCTNGVPIGSSPAHPMAWSKYMLGWVHPQIVNTFPLYDEVIDRVEDNDDVYLLLSNPGDSPGDLDWTWDGTGSGEYFLVENRQQVGYDSYIPGNGLMIWHIDESMADNLVDSHRLVDLEEADGMETYGDKSDPWESSSSGFTENSTPNSNYYNGTSSNVQIAKISSSSDSMSANLIVWSESDDWNPWDDSESDDGDLITTAELQEGINCWINEIPAPKTAAEVTTPRLQELINLWINT